MSKTKASPSAETRWEPDDSLRVTKYTADAVQLMQEVGKQLGRDDITSIGAIVRNIIKVRDSAKVHGLLSRLGQLDPSGNPELVPAILVGLYENSASPWVRMFLPGVLGDIGPGAVAAVPTLIACIESYTDASRPALALSRINPNASEAVPLLIERLRIPNRGDVVCVGYALSVIDPSAAKEFVEEISANIQPLLTRVDSEGEPQNVFRVIDPSAAQEFVEEISANIQPLPTWVDSEGEPQNVLRRQVLRRQVQRELQKRREIESAFAAAALGNIGRAAVVAVPRMREVLASERVREALPNEPSDSFLAAALEDALNKIEESSIAPTSREPDLWDILRSRDSFQSMLLDYESRRSSLPAETDSGIVAFPHMLSGEAPAAGTQPDTAVADAPATGASLEAELAEDTAPVDVAAVRAKMRQLLAESGMTQEEVGVAMGYARSGARTVVSRLLSADSDRDPQLSTLLAFAKAVGQSPKEFFEK